MSNDGSGPTKIEGEAVLASSSRADRLDGGNVFTKSGVNAADCKGSFLSAAPRLILLGEKERGGVEAAEVRRRRIRNLSKSAFP
jgi:hypothetical protein